MIRIQNNEKPSKGSLTMSGRRFSQGASSGMAGRGPEIQKKHPDDFTSVALSSGHFRAQGGEGGTNKSQLQLSGGLCSSISLQPQKVVLPLLKMSVDSGLEGYGENMMLSVGMNPDRWSLGRVWVFKPYPFHFRSTLLKLDALVQRALKSCR